MPHSTRMALLSSAMTLGMGVVLLAAGMFWHDILDFMLGTVIMFGALAYFIGWVNGQYHYYE